MHRFAADPGFSFADEYTLALAGFGVALFAAIGALSHQQERAFSASIIYLGLGLVAAVGLSLLGVPPLDHAADASLLEHITELALAIAVFSTGIAIERRVSWRGWRSVAGLICFAMPLSIAAVAAFAHYAMDLSLGAAIVLGALLCPTDPVLAGDVGVGPPGDTFEDEPRFNLGAEAGLNDGLAAPFVLLGLLVAGEGGSAWLPEWLAADFLYAVLLGGVIGAVGGYLMGGLAVRLRNADLLDRRLDYYFAIPTVLVIFGAAEFAGAYGLVAAFTGGLAFRRYEFGHEHNRHVHEGAEVVEKFGELVVILLLGSMITLSGLEVPGAAGWLLVPLLLFVIRPGLVMALFARSPMTLGERAFMGWFGVRGVAAIYYGSLAIGAGVMTSAEEATVFWTAAACVMVSIVLHGFSATALMRRLLGDGPSG